MQIVIDISKDRYDEIMSMDWKNCRLIFGEEIRAIHDGKALEQEPCEDCISRQAVLDDAGLGEFHRYDDYVKMRNYLKSLPSVSPQPKMGRWLNNKCSECGKGIEDLIDSPEWYSNEEPNFCPFCGVKLVDSQESEG